MNTLFDRWVDEALRNQQDLSPLRAVVEKELLHRDILGVMISSGQLAGMTFIGGTCLRACYGSERLSEDLDFAAGADFDAVKLKDLPSLIAAVVDRKYGLKVFVSEPQIHDDGVKTWTVKVETRPGRRDMPLQKINIDICPVPSHQRRTMMVRELYRSDSRANALLLLAESREEILADKWIALGLRRSRIKHRDLWDVAWLRRQAIKLPVELIPVKLTDHGRDQDEYWHLLGNRLEMLQKGDAMRGEFIREMQRFLPPAIYEKTVAQEGFWTYLVAELVEGASEIAKVLSRSS